MDLQFFLLQSCLSSDIGKALAKRGRLFWKPASPSLEPLASFCEPRKIPAKKSKNGHNALIWYLLHAGSITSDEIGLLTKSTLALTSLYSFFRIRYISEEKCGNDEPVCQKWKSQKILVDQNNWTTSRGDPKYSGQKNPPKFQESLGKHPRLSCVDAL